MFMVFAATLFIFVLLVGGNIWIQFGPFLTENWLAIAAVTVGLAGVGLYRFANFTDFNEPPSAAQWPTTAPSASPTEPSVEVGWTKVREDPDGIGEVWELADDSPYVRASGTDLSEVEFLRRRLEEEMRAKWQAQQLALDTNTCRLSGRVARIDRKDEEAAYGSIWLAIPDDQDGGYQAIRMHGAFSDLAPVAETDRVTLRASWRRGHLRWLEVESRGSCTEPMPEVTLPDPKSKDDVAKQADGQLPNLKELEKATAGDGWGSLNHCKYRAPMAWHLTTSPKYRAKSFAGRAAEVQDILREVAEAEGLRVIAVAAEADHIHLLGLPQGKGGMPPNWIWSRWVGRWKALTSKKLKALPGLEDFTWQVGYAITSVNGGKQGAEEALAVVRAYVEAQGDQGIEEGDEDQA